MATYQLTDNMYDRYERVSLWARGSRDEYEGLVAALDAVAAEFYGEGETATPAVQDLIGAIDLIDLRKVDPGARSYARSQKERAFSCACQLQDERLGEGTYSSYLVGVTCAVVRLLEAALF